MRVSIQPSSANGTSRTVPPGAEPLGRLAPGVILQVARRTCARPRQTYWLGLDIMDEYNFATSGQRPASVA